MNFLKKILLVAVISVSAESMGAIFDLPPDTPGLQQQDQNRSICNKSTLCKHIIVSGTLAAERYSHGYAYGYVDGFGTTREYVKGRSEEERQKDAITAAMTESGNIYFPIDGHQPTTEEAGQYSCANVNDVNVTDWYIRAFGGDIGLALSLGNPPPSVDNAPQTGFATDGSRSYIITVNTTGASANFARDFWQAFRIIASDPVGRVLLYRILIEIRRQNAGKGVCEMVGIAPSSTDLRNKNRHLDIIFSGPEGLSFNKAVHCIKFRNNVIKTSVLKLRANKISSILVERTPDIGLFHEMLHWFHCLRQPVRHSHEGIQYLKEIIII